MIELAAYLETFREFLRRANYQPDSPFLQQALSFVEKFPRRLTDEESAEINVLIRQAFHIPEASALEQDFRSPFDPLVPTTGWFARYHEYTLKSEPPAVFHFMCAYTVLGAVLERNVFFDKGFYKVFPNVAACLIAPTGKCRKTSATGIALSLARGVGATVLSERVTPEALVEGLKDREVGAGLLYAPELAVFLGRQKYLEGMVPLLTSLFDCPDTWTSTTIGRGEAALKNVALSFLGASTLEWFLDALPREAFSGGFMARILFVVQESTDRHFALPERQPGHLYEALREELQDLKQIKGEVKLLDEAKDWYTDWYRRHAATPILDDKFAGYHERKPDHLLRMAYLLRLAESHVCEITPTSLEASLRILDWIEGLLPKVFAGVAGTQIGSLHQKVVQELERAGGSLPHSILLRRVQHLMNARMFHDVIWTLKESETITEVHTNLEHKYTLATRRKK